MPCLVSDRCRVLASSASEPGVIRSRNSTTVTSAPRRRQTEPSSSPMMPAPITTSDLGTSGSDSAPVESTIRRWSTVTPGSPAGSEPVATTMALVSSVWPPTSTLPGPAILPAPLIQSTLFFLNRNSTPLVRALTDSAFCCIIWPRFSLGATSMPSTAKSLAAIS
jgi:hypothetical protein